MRVRSFRDGAALLWRRVACVAPALLAFLGACSPDNADLDRVGAPLRFADLRETSRWAPEFDPAWWTAIDRAYDLYDADVARIAEGDCEALLEALADAEQTGFPTERRAARAFWERHLRVRRELDLAESRLLDAIDEALPAGADGFVALARARAAFWRASATFAPHGQRMPGPLEVLALVGEPVAREEVMRAATDAYQRLAAASTRAADARFRAYLDYCERREAADAALAAASAARAALAPDAAPAEVAAADARVAEAGRAVEAAGTQLRDRDRREADEALRVAILREDRGVAAAIAEPERRADMLERVDAFLHLGVRSEPSLRAVRLVARRLVERLHDGDPERLARIDRAFEAYVAAAAPLRARLASGSATDRAQAYRALVALVEPFALEVAVVTGAPAQLIDLGAIDVSTGRRSAEEGADAVLAALGSMPDGGQSGDGAAHGAGSDPEVDAAFDSGIDEQIASARGSLPILTGLSLSSTVVHALVGDLGLDPAQSAELAASRADAAKRLAEAAPPLVERLGREIESTAQDRGRTPAARARDAVRLMRATVAEVRASDRAANARVLADAARLAGTGIDDERVARAALELELLSTIGAPRRSQEAQAIGGLMPAAATSPFEVIRTMGTDAESRDAALVLAFGHADRLRAAHDEAAAGILRNVESFLRHLLEREGREGPPESPWRASLSGTKAVEAREAIAVELGRALGDGVESAFRARWRALAEPGMEPPRHPSIGALANGAVRADGAPGAERGRDEVQAVIAQFVAQADESRERALRALDAWRAGFVRASDVASPDAWNGIMRHSAVGAWLRARVLDADERALARCDALLGGDPAFVETSRTIRRTPAPLPVRLTPYFPEALDTDAR